MPTESSFPKFDIPKQDLWGFIFERKDRAYPDDREAFVDPLTNRSYTYAQTRDAAVDFGKGLKALWDWQKGDVLALFTPNSIDTPVVTWGTIWAGGVISPANPTYTAEELAFQLKDSGAKALVTQKAFLPIATKAAQSVGIPAERIILLGDERDPSARYKHFTSIRNISGTQRYRRVKSDPEELVFLVYSSGTTGLPKGVMLCHRNITSNILQLAVIDVDSLSWKGGKDGKGDKTLAILPFFHIYGLTVLVHYSFYIGLQVYVLPKFEMELACKIIQERKISIMWVAPPVVLGFSKHPIVDKFDLSSLRMLISGAAPLTKELADAMYGRIKVPIKQAYGLSETSPGTHGQMWDDWDQHIGSVGKLLPNQVAKYMSPEEKEVAAGEVGELWISGPNIFMGYLNNEKGTRNAITDDGYFKTGDVGYQDKKGNFYITDRVKELIKFKGFQVPPAELEGLLLSHPEIDDVCVIGLYNKEQATELPRAYVVLKGGKKPASNTAKEIASWLSERVAQHKRLRGGVYFIDEVPKSASGKILRRAVKAKALEEEEKAGKAKL